MNLNADGAKPSALPAAIRKNDTPDHNQPDFSNLLQGNI